MRERNFRFSHWFRQLLWTLWVHGMNRDLIDIFKLNSQLIHINRPNNFTYFQERITYFLRHCIQKDRITSENPKWQNLSARKFRGSSSVMFQLWILTFLLQPILTLISCFSCFMILFCHWTNKQTVANTNHKRNLIKWSEMVLKFHNIKLN